jgi:glycolate oxidase
VNGAEIAELFAPIVGPAHVLVGDGNVHMAVFQKDAELRSRILGQLFEAGIALGGAISGEHGVGKEPLRPEQDPEPGDDLRLRRVACPR